MGRDLNKGVAWSSSSFKGGSLDCGEVKVETERPVLRCWCPFGAPTGACINPEGWEPLKSFEQEHDSIRFCFKSVIWTAWEMDRSVSHSPRALLDYLLLQKVNRVVNFH